MREAVDMMAFVDAAYAVGILATAGLVLWSWLDMRNAEKRREETREK